MNENLRPRPSNINFLLFVFVTSSIVCVHLLVYYLSYGDQQTKFDRWKKAENPVSENESITAVAYQFEGTIESLTQQNIVVANGGQNEEFQLPLAQFTIVKPFSAIEEWPTKIVVSNDRSKFKIGDRVIVLVAGDRFTPLEKNAFFASRIIKVEE